jgi:hypothetical protein
MRPEVEKIGVAGSLPCRTLAAANLGDAVDHHLRAAVAAGEVVGLTTTHPG